MEYLLYIWNINITNNMENINELVDIIRLERLKQRITQKEIAKMIGVERHTIVTNEKKGANPKFKLLIAQADALGLDIKIKIDKK